MKEACYLSSSRALLHHLQLTLSDVKFVSNTSATCATDRWEVWNVTLENRLLVPFAYSHRIWIETFVIKCFCESFCFHHFFVKFQTAQLVQQKFSSNGWFRRRRHCHKSERKGRWDTEKNASCDNAHVRSHHLHEWIDAWVCKCRRYFRSIFTFRIHGSSHKYCMGWSSSWSYWKRNLWEPCEHECSTPCWQECLVLRECPEVWMNINFR